MLPVLRFLLLLGSLAFAGDDSVAVLLQVLFVGCNGLAQGIQALLQGLQVTIGFGQVRFQAGLRFGRLGRKGPRLFGCRPGRFFVLFPAAQPGLASGDGLFEGFTGL